MRLAFLQFYSYLCVVKDVMPQQYHKNLCLPLSAKQQLQKEKLKAGIKEAFAEVRAMQAGKLKETTMEEFLESL
ncbi:MAG: hypothetical protein EAZ95_04130 [Bacteroidetes bacterium]|nr:MAG: hypothetical protein EAZ95_04130 [Bacteroidota bacterium]